jgi:hypothetical protein
MTSDIRRVVGAPAREIAQLVRRGVAPAKESRAGEHRGRSSSAAPPGTPLARSKGIMTNELSLKPTLTVTAVAFLAALMLALIALALA